MAHICARIIHAYIPNPNYPTLHTLLEVTYEYPSFARTIIWQNNYITFPVPVPWSLFEIILKGGRLVSF